MSTWQSARGADNNNAHIRPEPKSDTESQIERITHARKIVAQQICNGDDWLLPVLERFNTELQTLEGKQALLLQAAQIAKSAASNRAA